MIEEANVIGVPLLFAHAAVGSVKGGAQVDVVGPVVQELLAHHPDELTEYGLVVDEGSEDGKARHEFPPHLVWALVVLEMFLWRDRCTHADPLDEALPAAVREGVCCRADGDLGFGSIVVAPDGNVGLCVGFAVRKGEF